jgi:O-antigen/teichoic acid export membrane protein
VVLAVFFASVTANLEILWAAFFISKAFAGEVGFVMRLFSPGIALSLALAVVSFPALSKSIAETSLIDNRTILRVFREANMASFLFILAIGLGSIFLYQYWLPQDYTNIWWLFIAFGICFPLTCHGNLRKNIFILLGRQNLLFKSTLYTIVIKIVILGTLGIIFGKYALLPACALSMLWANLIYAKNDSVFRSIYSSQLRSFSILEAIKDKP